MPSARPARDPRRQRALEPPTDRGRRSSTTPPSTRASGWHAGDGPPPGALLHRQLRRATATRSAPTDYPVADAEGNPIPAAELTELVNDARAVVRDRRQPRRLRLHLHSRTTGSGARSLRDDQRRARDHDRRRRRPEPQLPDALELRQRGLLVATRPTTPTAAPRPPPSRRRGRSTASLQRVGFEFMINYHSAAELLLYGHGFQVQTERRRRPDLPGAVGHGRRPGDRRHVPGVAGPLRPRRFVRALHDQRRDHRAPLHQRYGTLAWTPEMDVSDPESRRRHRACSCSRTPTTDLQAAFEKNVPFALDVAKSADDPANPESHLGREALARSRSTVRRLRSATRRSCAVNARALARTGDRCTGGSTRATSRRAPTSELQRRRALRRRAATSTTTRSAVEVTGAAGGRRGPRLVHGRRRSSEQFTYDGALRHRQAACSCSRHEDYSGVGTSPPTRAPDGPFFLDFYGGALDRIRSSATTSTTSTPRGANAPDPLGVLSHYEAVIWYTGDDLLTREPGQGAGTGVARVGQRHGRRRTRLPERRRQAALHGPVRRTAAAQRVHLQRRGRASVLPAGGDPTTAGATASRSRTTSCSTTSAPTRSWTRREPPFAAQRPGRGCGAAGSPSPSSASTEFWLNGPASAENQEHVYSMVSTRRASCPPTEYPLFDVRAGGLSSTRPARIRARRRAASTRSPSPTTRAGSGCARRSI